MIGLHLHTTILSVCINHICHLCKGEFSKKIRDKITDKTQLQRFLESLNYVSHFYKDCAKDRKILNDRLKKDPMPWTEEHTKAMRKIKYKVRHLPILHVASDDLFKIVESDVSDQGWGAVLKQVKVDRSKPHEEIIQFSSGTWPDNGNNYAIIDKEIKASLNAINKFEIYLINKKCLLRTDVVAMNKVLHKKITKSREAKFARWKDLFANFDFDIEHIKGSENSIHDFLSREKLQASMCKRAREQEREDKQTWLQNKKNRM
jgi:hypothetical protein